MSTQQASTRLPVIDVEPFLSGEKGALQTTAKELQLALEDIGFLSIVGHGIEWRTVTECTTGRRTITLWMMLQS